MRIYDRYIIWLTVLFVLSTIALSVARLDLEAYFSVYLIECLGLTLLFVHLNRTARKGLYRIGYMLGIGFLFLVTVKIVEVMLHVQII